MDALKAIYQHELTASVFQDAHYQASQALELALQLSAGRAAPPPLPPMPAQLVTVENFKHYLDPQHAQ